MPYPGFFGGRHGQRSDLERREPGGRDRLHADRLARYETPLANGPGPRRPGAAMEELYSEDLRLGQLTAVQEIVGAMAFDPVLGDEIGRKMHPWGTFAEQLAARSEE